MAGVTADAACSAGGASSGGGIARLGNAAAVVAAGNLGLNFETLDERSVGLFQRLLDKARHDDVAADVDVLAEVESYWRHFEAEFDRLCRFTGQGAPNGPFVADGCG